MECNNSHDPRHSSSFVCFEYIPNDLLVLPWDLSVWGLPDGRVCAAQKGQQMLWLQKNEQGDIFPLSNQLCVQSQKYQWTVGCDRVMRRWWWQPMVGRHTKSKGRIMHTADTAPTVLPMVLPWEIWDQILDFIRDSLVVSSVCKSFHRLMRFRTVKLFLHPTTLLHEMMGLHLVGEQMRTLRLHSGPTEACTCVRMATHVQGVVMSHCFSSLLSLAPAQRSVLPVCHPQQSLLSGRCGCPGGCSHGTVSNSVGDTVAGAFHKPL